MERMMRGENYPLEIQFSDKSQQKEASLLGMWIFLATEVLFFGGFFTAYAAYYSLYKDGFFTGAQHLNWQLGGVNTFILLTSSWLVALSIHNIKSHKRGSVFFLLGSIFLGLIFLSIKSYEYFHHFKKGFFPGENFSYQGEDQLIVELFYYLYFFGTSIHAIHLIIGIFLLSTMAGLIIRGEIDSVYHTPLEVVGLYWHFVDLVWLFLYPLLYLIGRA